MDAHPDLEPEQAYIDNAYERLAAARQAAMRLRSTTTVGKGGTHQARWEADVIEDTIRQRLAGLELGDAPLVFGRIDRNDGERFYVGRLGLTDDHGDTVLVDWRAPVAEPFYRATGREPLGLAGRRHFICRGGRTLVDIEEEIFGEGGIPSGGRAAVVAAIEQGRTGRLTEIVGTIQAEQDEIIRDELAGVLVVQGGPGTGKTVVALHRAAYLLYTHRFPLEGQGVLVVGPNRVFLRYIERVLPALGESGVELATLGDLAPPVGIRGRDDASVARLKGDPRAAGLVAKAVRDRQRRLREDLVLPFGAGTVQLTAADSAEVVRAGRRARTHNAGRRLVEQRLWARLAASARRPTGPDAVRAGLRRHPLVREALEWMWPLLTPQELLHDLYGSPALLGLAARGSLPVDAARALHRPRSLSADDAPWSEADLPLLDEARAHLGPRPGRDEPDDARTYGHIVVDEAQDLSPMELRMIARRSLNASMTVVGDVAQATGAHPYGSWDDVLAHLPARRPPRLRELTVGYRTPAPIMTVAARVLAAVLPELTPPSALRPSGAPPRFVAAAGDALAATVAAAAGEELHAVDPGTVGVVCPRDRGHELEEALAAAGVEHGRAERDGLDHPVTVVPAHLSKGLELDAVVVVEPAAIVADEPQGLRALYVALTRATRRLTVVHADRLPAPLHP